MDATYPLDENGIKVTDLTISPNNNIYGFSKKYWHEIDQNFNPTPYLLPKILEAYDVHFDSQKNLFYIQGFNNAANDVVTYIIDAQNNTSLTSVTSANRYLINTVDGHNLSYFNPESAILYTGNHGIATSSKTTCPFTRSMDTPWQWLSYPRLQRTGNDPVVATTTLEDLNPIPYNLNFYSNEDGNEQFIVRTYGTWSSTPFNEIKSTKGYKLNIQDQGTFTHTMYGTDLYLNTPIQLYRGQSGNPENWIGYFMPMSLEPEDAFVGVWEYLTKIQTQDWTMTKTSTGKWLSPASVAPLKYGDCVIVEVSQNCTLYWNEDGEPSEGEDRAGTEYFGYTEFASYIPWYIETDSLEDVVEIGLMANDSCIGASVVMPGDTLVEVNAYTQAVPPGTPVEIVTWEGYKSTAKRRNDYLVNNFRTGIKENRRVYTGEGQPYYYISFGDGQNNSPPANTQPVRIINVSPNPCKDYTNINFSVGMDAWIKIAVAGINGQPVATLTNGYYSVGSYQAEWHPGEQPGNRVQNGIYIIRLIADDRIVQNEKVVLIR